MHILRGGWTVRHDLICNSKAIPIQSCSAVSVYVSLCVEVCKVYITTACLNLRKSSDKSDKWHLCTWTTEMLILYPTSVLSLFRAKLWAGSLTLEDSELWGQDVEGYSLVFGSLVQFNQPGQRLVSNSPLHDIPGFLWRFLRAVIGWGWCSL